MYDAYYHVNLVAHRDTELVTLTTASDRCHRHLFDGTRECSNNAIRLVAEGAAIHAPFG